MTQLTYGQRYYRDHRAERLAYGRKLYKTKDYREKNNAWQKKKYATDPNYRKKKIANAVRWRRKHPEKFLAYQRKYQRQHNV